jgi:dipeptidyl-peptidase-4
MGTPADNAAGYARSSVVTHANALAAPLLMIHGMADDNVLFAHSTKLFAELQRLRKPFDVMVYPGYKHGLTRQAAVGPHALATIARYLEEHLRPVPAAVTGTKSPAGPDVRIPALPGAEERR